MNKNNYYFFEDAYCFWPAYKRIIYKSLLTGLISLGFIFSCFFLIFKLSFLKELSPFLLFFFIYLSFKKNRPELYFPLSEKKGERKINLAHFITPSLKEALIFTRENLSLLLPEASLLIILLNEKKIKENLLKLEIKEGEIKEIKEKIFKEFKIDFNYDQKLKETLNNLAPRLKEVANSLNLNYINEEVFFLALIENFPELEEIFLNYKVSKEDLKIIFKLAQLKNKKISVLIGLSELERNIFREIEKIKVNPSLTSRPTPLLNKYGLDFTELANSLKIGIMIGHKNEYNSLLNILTREGKRNVLLIGPSGIGKETIVSYLAYNIVRDNIPPVLKYHRLICISLSSFLSAEKDYVALYNILKRIIEEVILNKDLIIYFKDFYLFKTFSDESGFSALDALQPLFDSPFIKIIADSPLNEFHRYLENHPLIKENFDLIEVKEVDPNEAVEILTLRSLEWEKKKKTTISYKAIKRSVFLAERFFKNIPLPSSAENLLTETIEGVKRENRKIVEENDVINLVSRKTEIPLEVSTEEEKEKLLNLENIIHQYIINQEEAVNLAASYLRQYRAGLAETKKPIGVFLFVGPTGVGKTELSKTLAKIYFGNEKLMIRFDMSEYQDQRSIFRFIGDPEGNIVGELTEAVKRKPYSLILLDEFEKAHPKVLDLFLQVFDEGRLTDNFGETIDFTQTIIIATSNARSDYIKEELSKNTPYEQLKEEFKKILLDYFKPELLNRFDEIIIFKPLTINNLEEIVKLKLNSFKEQVFESQSLIIDFEKEVIKKIAELGYNPILGARPLNSVIRKMIKDPLAKMILSFKELPKEKNIVFCLENNQIILKEK
ncbi:MAG: AAA family ATPase [Minisyncoccia bacterium]